MSATDRYLVGETLRFILACIATLTMRVVGRENSEATLREINSRLAHIVEWRDGA